MKTKQKAARAPRGRLPGPPGVFQMGYSKWCIPNGVFQMVYFKWCILNGVFSVPSPCHFTFWGISLSSTEIPGVFNPGYSQRCISVVYFLSFLRSAAHLDARLLLQLPRCCLRRVDCICTLILVGTLTGVFAHGACVFCQISSD